MSEGLDLFEAKRLRAIELKRADMTLPARVIASRLNIGLSTARTWLRDAGLLTGGRQYHW